MLKSKGNFLLCPLLESLMYLPWAIGLEIWALSYVGQIFQRSLAKFLPFHFLWNEVRVGGGVMEKTEGQCPDQFLLSICEDASVQSW